MHRQAKTAYSRSARVAIHFGLGALSNRHFDNILFPLGTPHAEYLPRYARAGLDVLELDVAYHRLELPPEVATWLDTAPSKFRFHAKLWKAAVAPPEKTEWGEDALTAAGASLDALREALGHRLDAVVAQFPPRFQHSVARAAWLDKALTLAPGRLVVELRHASWWRPEIESMLRRRDAALVWSTFDKAPSPAWRTGSRVYVRFTGRAHKSKHTRGRPLQRKDRLDDVLEMRARVAAPASDTDVSVIVTNPFEGNAVDSLPRIVAALAGPERAQPLRRGPGRPLLERAPP